MSSATLPDPAPSTPTTRLAPSPTGALHLGNLRTFLINWALARQRGWHVVLRIEDLDGPRVKQDAAAEVMDLLDWLGIDWDEGPYYQTRDLTPYRSALHQLASQGLVYACRCTRSQILAASLSAPHGDHHELRYPGTCRPAVRRVVSPSELDDTTYGWRLRVSDESMTVVDQFAGTTTINVQQTVGDFVVAAKGGLPSYQLAVVVDDARQQVVRIVRGDDLLSSVPRQQFLYRALDLQPRPDYWHLPLVRGSDRRRLAKRHGDTRMATYRQQGVSASRIIALLAHWCCISPRSDHMCLAEFVERFDISDMSKDPIVFASSDDAWLRTP